MTIRDIYEKVNLVIPLEQRQFFNYFDDTISELKASYRDFVIEKDVEYEKPTDLSDYNSVLPLYHGAVVDNIIFMVTNEETRKSEFIRKSREAYLKYWTDNAKGRKIKNTRRWQYV